MDKSVNFILKEREEVFRTLEQWFFINEGAVYNILIFLILKQ